MKHQTFLRVVIYLTTVCFPLFVEAQEEVKIKRELKEISVFSKPVQEYLQKKISDFDLEDRAMACTPITNDNCTNAWTLNVGTGSIGRTTCNGTIESGEDIACGFIEGVNQSVWFKFTAQNIQYHTVGIVEQNPSGNPCTNSCPECYISTVVWESNNGSCPIGQNCKMVSCQSSINGPRRQEHVLEGLNPGSIYYVQVMYKAGGVCGDFGNFNIFVSNYRRDSLVALHVTNPTPHHICENANPTCNIVDPSIPSVATILSSCTTTTNTSRDTLNSVVRNCFVVNTNDNNFLNFSNYIESNCLGWNQDWDTSQNVSWAYWSVENMSCDPIVCGFLGNQNVVSVPNLLCNTDYKVCIQYEIKNCTHTNYTFYSFGPNIICVLLPVELIDFEVLQYEKVIKILWQTATEVNSEKFIIEKSRDGIDFYSIFEIPSRGDQSSGVKYEAYDLNPLRGKNYYRLKQVDKDGVYEYSEIKTIFFNDDSDFLINYDYQNQKIKVEIGESSVLHLRNTYGQIIYSEKIIDTAIIDVSKYSKGIYLIYIGNIYKSKTFKLNLTGD